VRRSPEEDHLTKVGSAPHLKVPSDRRGQEIVNDPLFNKGTSFAVAERDRLGLRGLVPPAVLTMDEQLQKIMATLRALPDDLAKHMFLADLNDRNATLFHRALVRHIEELAPLVYTPTVGRACQLFASTYRRPRGMYFSADDVGHMQAMVANWPAKTVSVVVVTDGSRILGLGDLGANGMGIPIGKLALYCAAGGVAPHRVMPVVIDVGTNNQSLLEDPFYLGLKRPRLEGAAFFDVVDEFVEALYSRWPDALIQFEDFSSDNAKTLLDRYKDRRLCFNDDIQGTGATVVAGVLASLKTQTQSSTDVIEALKTQRIVVCGAGSAGCGVAAALARAAGDVNAENYYVLDKDGLIAKDGASEAEWAALAPEQRAFGESFSMKNGLRRGASLLEVITAAKPSILLGLTASPGLFTEEVIRAFDAACPAGQRPVVMALSNPTDRAECTARQAYEWTAGRAVFASGSPFAPVDLDGTILVPSQCNNMFLFPGIGLGATLAKARRVSDEMLLAASEACAGSVSAEEQARGQVFPSVSRIRDVSKAVAVAVIRKAREQNLARMSSLERDDDIEAFVEAKSYFPYYTPLYQSPYV